MSTPAVGTAPGPKGGAPTSAPSPGARPWQTGPRKGKAAKGPSVGATVGGIPRPTLRPPRTPVGGKDWAGFGLGLVLHALIVSYIRYGKAGPKGWLSAKFLNQPIQGDDLQRENRGGSTHEDPNSVPWEDLTPEERKNLA